MIYRIVLIAAAVFVVAQSGDALACSCMSKGSFVEYVKQSDGVIRARVAGYGDKLSHGETLFESMTVDVVTVLKGDLRFESITLLGDPGFMCRDYVDSRNFVIGKEYLIALHTDESTQPFGGCGEAWLKLDDGIASGHQWNDGEWQEYSIPLVELLENLKGN